MSQSSQKTDLTVDEYLALEEQGQLRHEYVDGQIFAMTGATEAHNVICMNLSTTIHTHLKGSGCRVFSNDMKVRIETANSFYYPDIMVTCEPYDGKSVFKQSPVLIAEILSPSTKHIDRREKLVAYRKLSSLAQYLIIHQDRYRLESHKRNINGEWEVTVLGKADVLCLDCLGAPASAGITYGLPTGIDLAVAAIYDGVVLEPLVEEEEVEYEFSQR